MTLVQTLEVNVSTGQEIIKEVEMELPNPRLGEIERRLQEIRVALQQTDYKQAKYLDGDYTDEQYAPIRDERKALRVEYNQLEEELSNLI